MKAVNNYYVYAYIDPRNHQEFYYGKGKGSRKNSHLKNESDSEKREIINAITKEGLAPVIKVIAANLTEDEAHLIETTLIWKLGKYTTNIASGLFEHKFRPRDTLHKDLFGFDFQNRIYYYNVGESPHRNWDDYRRYNYISAGGNKRWRDAMRGFSVGDIFAAYLKGHGFVGIGRIAQKALPAREIEIQNKKFIELSLKPRKIHEFIDDNLKCEYVALVDWLKAVPKAQGKFKKNSGLYTTTHVRASLEGQPKTIKFLNKAFNIDLAKLAQ